MKMKLKRIVKTCTLLFIVVIMLLSTQNIPAVSTSPSKISDYLYQAMVKADSDTLIDGVYVELSIDDKDYEQAVVDDETTVKDIEEQILDLDDESSYDTVKELIVKKRRALCDYCYQRNEHFISELQIERGTLYNSSLNVILGSYTLEEIYRLQKDERVLSIGKDDPNAVLVSDINIIYTHPCIEKIHNVGYSGNGIRIGVIEQARECFNSTSITSVAVAGEPSSDLIGLFGTEHAKRVVGIIQKVAPSAHIYITRISDSTNAMTQIMNAAYILAYTYEVDVLNISQGQYSTANNGSSAATYLNNLVKNLDLTICCSCGNEVDDNNTRVSILASGENVIGVGGAKSNGVGSYTGINAYTGAYWRYSEYNSTSYVNKPDFCAPAVNITVPAYSMNTGASGTSFSTPIVSGTVALLMHKNSTLIGKQSLVKALLSAGAKYRGDTATYIDPVTNTNVFFSDKEGTGIIDAYNSYTVLNQSRYITKSITQSSTSPYTKTFTVSSGDAVIRVSLSWLKRNAMSNFDLYVYKGSTLVAKNAASCVNTNMNMGSYQSLRTVSFDPSDYGYGTYTIKIVYQNVVNSSDSFSVAWY